MNTRLNRREFLKLVASGGASLALLPSFKEEMPATALGRIATKSLSVYSLPSDESQILYQRNRDDLVNIYYEVESEYGPGYNPIWYRVWRGYIHRAHVQKVMVKYNPVLTTIPNDKQVLEVTVPYSQTYRFTKYEGWQPLYRLYYGSVHWAVGVDEGPDGTPWYQILDELSEIKYHAPAVHFRPIEVAEFAPISPDVHFSKKRIEVSITRQILTAYENDQVVLETKISSGVSSSNPNPPNGIPTKTPKGTYYLQSKMPSKHMGDGQLTSDLEAYELPGVPWVCFLETKNGVAIHGTYWHDNFGVPMSHGCINVPNTDAKWIYRWTTPIATHEDIEKRGFGTKVVVF